MEFQGPESGFPGFLRQPILIGFGTTLTYFLQKGMVLCIWLFHVVSVSRTDLQREFGEFGHVTARHRHHLESGFERLEYVDYLNEVHSSGFGAKAKLPFKSGCTHTLS